MTPDQIQLVQRSFANEAATLFYGRLFEIAPEVRPLFKSELTEETKTAGSAACAALSGVMINAAYPGAAAAVE